MTGQLVQFAAKLLVRCRWLALVWLAIGAMGLQVVATPGMAALDRLIADSQELEEEESEPAESSGEEELPQVCGTSVARLRRTDVAALGKIITDHALSNSARIVQSTAPAQLSRRNGIGGPLRC